MHLPQCLLWLRQWSVMRISSGGLEVKAAEGNLKKLPDYRHVDTIVYATSYY